MDGRAPGARLVPGARWGRASVLCEVRARRPPGAQWKTDLFPEPGTFSTTLSLSLQMVYRDVAAPLHHSTSFSFSLSLFLSFSLSLFLSFFLSFLLSFFLPSFLSFFLSFSVSLSLSLSLALSLPPSLPKSLPPPPFLYDSIYKDADGQARALSVDSRNGSVSLCV